MPSVPGLPRGVVSGLGAAVLFGLSTPLAKLLLPSSGTFMQAVLLYLSAGIGLTVIAPLRRAGREAPIRGSDLPTLAAIPILGEPLTWKGVAAGIVMGVGVVVLVRARHGHRHAHDAEGHDHAHVRDEHHSHAHHPDPHHRHRH